MTIFLLILKIILYIVLILLSILLGILLIILFVPINYECRGEYYEELVLKAKITWLFRIIQFNYNYDKESNYRGKILWKTFATSEDSYNNSNHDTGNNNKKTTSTQDEIDKEEVNKDETNIDSVEAKRIDNEKNNRKNYVNDAIIDVGQKTIHMENEKREQTSNINKSKKVKKEKRDNQKNKKQNSKFKEIYSKIKDFIENEDYKGVIKFVFGKIYKLLKKLLPRKYSMNLSVGTGDPATTGYLIGLLSMLYAVCKQEFRVTPNFYEKEFKGKFYLKGRIFIFIIVFYGISIILDKRVRKLIAEYKF